MFLVSNARWCFTRLFSILNTIPDWSVQLSSATIFGALIFYGLNFDLISTDACLYSVANSHIVMRDSICAMCTLLCSTVCHLQCDMHLLCAVGISSCCAYLTSYHIHFTMYCLHLAVLSVGSVISAFT